MNERRWTAVNLLLIAMAIMTVNVTKEVL